MRRSLRALQGAVDAPGFAPVDTVVLDADPTSPDAGAFAVAAWFLGTKGENADEFERLVVEAIRDHVHWRRNFHPADPTFITEETKAHPVYRQAMGALKDAYLELLAPAEEVGPVLQHAVPGPHELGPHPPGHARLLRHDALQPEQRGVRGVGRDHDPRDPGRRRPLQDAGLQDPRAPAREPSEASAFASPAPRSTDWLSRWNRLSESQRGWVLAMAGARARQGQRPWRRGRPRGVTPRARSSHPVYGRGATSPATARWRTSKRSGRPAT